MGGLENRYVSATRHPWVNFLFLVPLFAIYELGVYWMGGPNPETLRNGADFWLRWFLERYGFGQLWAAPVIVLSYFLFRAILNYQDRPRNIISVSFGMLVECTIYAFLLWVLSRNFQQILEATGLPLLQIQFKTVAAGQLVTFVGAGIYEEVLFRLGLFSLCVFLLRIVLLPSIVAVPIAAVFAAIVFSAAHHVYGQPLDRPVFLFRIMAGLYFTALYVARGFGVAVGAHAGYDILVGVVVPQAQAT